MSNVGENKTGGLFSFRVHNMYVASIGSIHPVTRKSYEIAEDYPVIPMPDDFLDWLQSQVVEKPKTRDEVVDRGKYKKGTRYNALMSELGSLWNRGYDRAGLLEAGLAWARVHFDTGAAEFDEALVTKEIEHYADSYGDGQDKSLVLNQQPSQPAPAALDGPQVWGEIIPLDTILLPVPPFEERFLPVSIRPYCLDVANRMSVPLDFAGIAALETLFGVIGRRVFVYPKALDKSWHESLALSGGIVAGSGRLKTPVWKLFTNLTVEQELDWARHYSREFAAYKEIHKKWEESVKAAKGKKDAEPVGEEPQEPLKPQRLVLNDSTPEKVHSLMSENPTGLFALN